jgi:uncharacterized SAM-binding protein YcdF (DUF218 family)
LIAFALLLALLTVVSGEAYLYRAIRRQAVREEARPAAAIVVFGAAQYNGQPSPVLKARLDHALDLEEEGLAPTVITTGGSGGDLHYTEAGVAQDYLVQQGVAESKVITDSHSDTSYESVKAVTLILRARHGADCIAVSDGFHLYRLKRMFASRGITAYGSPAPDSPIEAQPFERFLHTFREMVSSTAWYLGIRY